MSFLNYSCLASAAVILSTAHAAQADVGAQDVWSNWQRYFESFGYEISASENRSGETLTVSDLKIVNPSSDDTVTSTVRFDTVAFTENGDGTVGIVLPDVMPFQVQMIGEDGEMADMELEIRQSGLASTVSGVPTEMTNTYAAQSVELVLTGLSIDGELQDMNGAVARALTQGITGTIKSTMGGKRVYDNEMQADSLKYDLDYTDPENTGNVKMSGQMADLSMSGTSSMPLAKMDPTDVSAMLSAGLEGDATITYSAGTSNITVVENNAEAFSTATTSAGGALDVTVGAEGVSYSGTQNSLTVSMNSPDFPVPIEFDMANASFNLAMPVQPSDTPSDFALGFAFNDFSMSDLIWGMFDPGAQLPRDPATLALDLTGKARLLFDLLDPTSAAQASSAATPPVEVETLDINKLQVTVAGAELTGDGAFRFDNSAPTGIQQPIGSADLSLSGGNKLIDTLVAMGLLPEEQAMGARMMMGLLAVPGSEPDTLKSRIEMNEQGHIMANGQRIQ